MDQLASERPAGRDNNIGLLRLLFAGLVLLAHSSVLVDGNGSREIFQTLFGTIPGGDIAVDAFFLVSGYLVSASFATSASVSSYLVKRCARILPGYVVSFLICVLIVAPLAGAALSTGMVWSQLLRIPYLLFPTVPGAFKGLPYSNLNGSMWTISYEFGCYIVTAAIGMVGLSRPGARWVLVPIVAALLVVAATGGLDAMGIADPARWSVAALCARLFAFYGVGALFYLYRSRIALTTRGAGLAAALLVPMMFVQSLAQPALAICGGYLVFWTAFVVRRPPFIRFDRETDVSYGLYLYAWPIQNLLIYNDRTITPWMVFGLSLPLSLLAGWASWRLVERPCLSIARRWLAGLPPWRGASGLRPASMLRHQTIR